MRSMRVGMGLFVSILAGCGGGGYDPDAPGPAIKLMPLVTSPSCYHEPEVSGGLTAAPPSDAFLQMMAVMRSQAEFQRSYLVREAELLLAPVIADPTAAKWEKVTDGVHQSGHVLARGAGWSTFKVVLFGTGPDGVDFSYQATVDTTPSRTLLDFGAQELELRENLVRVADATLACDPATGQSVEQIGTGLSLVRSCWLAGDEMPRPTEPAAAAEFEASHQLKCAQFASSLLNR
ncbi:MAG: hypothetical protein U1E65_09565 [Myxococcota bacterium]